MPSKNEDRIFLCHASEDKLRVKEVYQQLKSLGYNPWMDKMDLLPGQNWQEVIVETIEKSRFFIPFFSKTSVSKRGFVQHEFKLALDTALKIPEGQIFIIPVRLDDCSIPKSFTHIHYVDLFEGEGFDLVLRVLGMEMGEVSSRKRAKILTEPSNQFTDPRDGQVYKTVNLLGKTWMAENLNFDVGEGCWFYDDYPQNEEKYGRLYTWEAAKKACPPAWRLPTDEEWKALAMHFGGYHDWINKRNIGDPKKAYKALIKGGDSGFAALLSGWRFSGGSFLSLDSYCGYWSSTPNGTSGAWYYDFDSSDGKLYRNYLGRGRGRSVRCLQDL